jgi:hypothetical protein
MTMIIVQFIIVAKCRPGKRSATRKNGYFIKARMPDERQAEHHADAGNQCSLSRGYRGRPASRKRTRWPHGQAVPQTRQRGSALLTTGVTKIACPLRMRLAGRVPRASGRNPASQ